MDFSELGLSPELLRAVSSAGYISPTPIQQQSIPHVMSGRDVLGCAQTGTGKTASFALPMIDKLTAGRARARMPRSLVLEPTRELATQVEVAFEVYGKNHKLNTALLIGGESFTDQERKLDRGVDVLIATPGRMIDLFERGKILLSDVRILVIDEADRMLDMGFIPDVERIVSMLPKSRQTLFFSATMPTEIRRLASAFLKDPAEVSVAPPASPAETVAQSLVVVAPDDKREALRRLIRSEDVKNALIFCNRKRDVDILYKSLTKHGFDAAALHGDMSQPKRTETLERFKNSEIRLLVCSDVAARGLDIQGLSHVFCFDVPYHAEDYVHRIGRTGRAGREGRSFTLAAPEDGKSVAAIQKLIARDIPPITIPGIPVEELDFDSKPRGRRPAGARPAPDRSRSRPSRDDDRPARRPKSSDRQSSDQQSPNRPSAKPIRQDDSHAAGTAREANVTPFPKRDPRPRRNERDRDHDDGPIAPGFGDHMPAFLARAPRLAGQG
jgi:superfamily II DNA/RNA helicase